MFYPRCSHMLLELQISDFAIIEQLHLRLEPGFNVLTGETGAGKSIIIDALGTLRGGKTDPAAVRTGSMRARVEGVFSLTDCPALESSLREYGLWEEDDDHVILTREISAESGRSVARINGRAVSISVLRDIGGRLVDIHGQHEGLSLFNVRTHLDMLDRFGNLLHLREQISDLADQVRQARDELETLDQNESRRLERIAELRYLIEDVSAVQPQPTEEHDLLHERQVLQNAARITDLVHTAYTLLYQSDEAHRSRATPAVETMARIADSLIELARFDAEAEKLADHATELRYQVEDLAATVRAYRDHLDFEPGRLDEIEERLTVLRDLQRKYNGAIPELLERAADAETEIERLSHSAEYRASLEAREAELLNELGAIASDLSRRRRTTGDELAREIEGAMGDLAMPHVQFHVSITYEADPQGVRANTDAIHDQYAAFDKTGIDRVEFLISPNPGESLKPLARIASGGESARLLLALKSILSRVDDVPTLVFDEIDVGVGGRAGQVVGQKLWGMTETHQVICISHLPQVAAFADTHYAISKEIIDNRTRTRIDRLNNEERIDELAAMLDGTPVSEHSRGNAREITERSTALKRRHHNQTQNAPSSKTLESNPDPVADR